MKRIFIIAILISYSIATFGVSLNYFYCCGKLKTVSLALKTEDKDCTGKAKKGCCDNKTVTIKLKVDQQKSADQSNLNFGAPFLPVILPAGNYTGLNIADNGKIKPLYKRPPTGKPPSRQILFCVFRL